MVARYIETVLTSVEQLAESSYLANIIDVLKVGSITQLLRKGSFSVPMVCSNTVEYIKLLFEIRNGLLP